MFWSIYHGTYVFGRFYTWIKAVETPAAAPPRHATDVEKGGEKAEDESEEIMFQAPEERE